MGLLNKLTKQGGTNLSPYDGATPKVNPGATKQSKLHAFGNTPGYSLNGAYTPDVTAAYTEYNDGYNNALPQPSQLDRNGVIAPSKKYLNNLPR
jgi:hypothetical protein